MKTGRRLWAIIFIKLFVMFAILKLFFFPNYLETHFSNDEARAGHVMENITRFPHSRLDSDQDREHPAWGDKGKRAATRQYMEYGEEPHRAADSVQSPLAEDSVQSSLEEGKGIGLKATRN